MEERLLPLADIHALGNHLREIFLFMIEMRGRSPLAKRIKFPQVPSSLSESLAVHLIRRGLILPEYKGQTVRLSNGIADILVTSVSPIVTIEVKATAEKGYQRLSEGDVRADVLVWVHFDSYFMASKDEAVSIFVIAKPGRFYRAKEDVFVKDIPTKTGGDFAKVVVQLSTLQ